jgi:beta-carotene 3-hydroxylase
MHYVVGILIVLIAFLSMELVAWLTHKYIMHGFLWSLHKDHHDHSNNSRFEKNDYFFVIFAIPGILNILFGINDFSAPYFWIGLGITLYGATYFFIHDLLIHQRIKILRNTTNPYLLLLRRAHKIHHKSIKKMGGESFGMLLFVKYRSNKTVKEH